MMVIKVSVSHIIHMSDLFMLDIPDKKENDPGERWADFSWLENAESSDWRPWAWRKEGRLRPNWNSLSNRKYLKEHGEAITDRIFGHSGKNWWTMYWLWKMYLWTPTRWTGITRGGASCCRTSAATWMRIWWRPMAAMGGQNAGECSRLLRG